MLRISAGEPELSMSSGACPPPTRLAGALVVESSIFSTTMFDRAHALDARIRDTPATGRRAMAVKARWLVRLCRRHRQPAVGLRASSARLHHGRRMMATPVIDITGWRFGRLIAIARVAPIDSFAAWRLRCDCGSEVVKGGSDLRAGYVLSCGCLRQECAAGLNIEHRHKQDRQPSRTYHTW